MPVLGGVFAPTNCDEAREVVDEDIMAGPFATGGFSHINPDRIAGDLGFPFWPRTSKTADVLEKLLEAQNSTIKEIPDV